MLVTSTNSPESAKKVSDFLELFLTQLRNYFLMFYLIGKAEYSKEDLEKLENFIKVLDFNISAKQLLEVIPEFVSESSLDFVNEVFKEILKIKEDISNISLSEPHEHIFSLIKEIENSEDITTEEKEALIKKIYQINQFALA